MPLTTWTYTGSQYTPLLDLKLRIKGQDSGGHPFFRIKTGNLLALQPWRDFRSSRADTETLLTQAQVRYSEYRDGQIVGLMLEHAGKHRTVRVTTDALGRALMGLDMDKGEWLFGVRKNHLLSVVRLLEDTATDARNAGRTQMEC